jgi:hypothetical protein
MKEVNKIIGKKGKYKNLTQKDIDRIVDQTNDHIFQRDPDNLFVEDRPMFKKKTLPKIDDKLLKNYNKEIKEGVASIMSDTSPEGLAKSIEIDNLMLKYPGMDRKLADLITSSPPTMKADMIAKVEQTFELDKQGKSGNEIIDIFKKETDRTKQADGGITQLRNGYSDGNIVYDGEGPIQFDLPFGEPMFTMTMNGKLYGIYKNKNGSHLSVPLGKDGKVNYAKGGRAGYYGGGQAMVGEDLSQIGHGADALMARNMQLAPNSMATTSTGLNYLLGEDNDTVRVPYNEGNMVLPKAKPAQNPLVELSRIYKTYEEAMPGVSKDTQQFLRNDFIQKLQDAKISQEEFMTYRMQNNFADGGRIGYANGSPNPFMPMQNRQQMLNALNQQNFRPRPFDPRPFRKAPPTEYSKMMDKQSVYTPFNSGRIKNEFDEKTQIAFDEGAKIAQNQPFDLLADEFAEQGYSSNMRHGLGSSAFKDAAIDYITSNTPLKSNSRLANDLGIFASNAGSLFTEVPDMFSQAKAVAESKGPYGSIDDYLDEPDTRFLTQPIEDIKANYVGSQIPFSLRNNLEGKKYFIDNYYKYGSNTMNQLKLDQERAMQNKIKKKNNFKNQPSMENAIITAMAQQNKDRGTGGYQSSFGQDTGFMEGSGTAAEMGSFADGGIAGLRKGYAGGKGVDLARRSFLKILGGSVAAATAFKTGLVKMLGKESGAVSKKAVDEFFASGTSGAPTWFEPLVNKALKEGLDITEKAAVKDGQIVKSLDTPTGKVDVTYDTRTGAVDIDYMGGDTAMGEGLQMRYAPGEIIEEGANMGKKSDDVFEAVETVPEGNMYSPDDYQVEFGENMTSNIDDLYSDTSELKKLGGEKLLVKDISNTLKKKKVLKEMDNNPDQFASDNLPDYDY